MTATVGSSGRQAWVVAALIFLWLAATAWVRPLMLPDEGRYVGVAWEMIRSGDWLTPTLNGLPYFHKPPLFYWITAGSLSVFGLNEWAARAAPILGAWLGAWSLYLFARHWSGERAARMALLALLAQPLFYLGGQFANLDMLVAGCISATILSLAHAALNVERSQPYRRMLAVAYALAALGVLAKGLIGAVIPALVVLAWLVLGRRWRALRALLWWPGMVLFLALAGPWFVAMQNQFADFADYFFVVQHFKRYAAGGFNNVEPFWFYPALLLVFSLPWLPWLNRLATRRTASEPGSEQGAIRWLMLIWVGTVVLFFSMPQSKLIGYILPAVPPLAYLMADGLLIRGTPTPRAQRLWWVSAGVTVALSLAAVVVISQQPRQSSRELAAALEAQRGPHEPVFMLNGYYYDVPFYAHLQAPAQVVDDWSSPEVSQRDNWRKELADAGQFATAQARVALLRPQSLPAAVCVAPVSWVIGPAGSDLRYPFLTRARAVFTRHDTTLWRVDSASPGVASSLACAGTPNVGSTDK